MSHMHREGRSDRWFRVVRPMPAVLLLAFAPLATAQATTYECTVTRKYDANGTVYTSAQILRWAFSARVVVLANGTIVQRCSRTSQSDVVSCDTYNVDRTEVSSPVGGQKFYVFRSQYDLQIFTDGTFVENNGRGGLASGNCRTS
jgi:hypothetical protein